MLITIDTIIYLIYNGNCNNTVHITQFTGANKPGAKTRINFKTGQRLNNIIDILFSLGNIRR